MTAVLVRRNPELPFQLFLFVGVTAAVVGINNIWHFYGGLPPFDRLPARFEGIPGLTMYYNPNWIAQLYGVVCVGTVAAATRLETARGVTALLVLSATVLFACVALTQTRSVLISVLASIGLIIALLPRQMPARRVIQVGVIVCAILASLPFFESLLSRGDSYRLAFWTAYLNHVEAHPWVGSGLSAEIVAIAPDGFQTTHPHNIIYHALLRGGVFAAAALVVFMLTTFVGAVRAWQMTRSAIYPALIVAAFFPLQLEFTVMVGTSVGWDWVVLWMPIGLCIGAELLERDRYAHSELD
jgi:O-antigen ligase